MLKTYREFLELVSRKGWTVGQVRFDERPSQDLLDTVDRVGLIRWEKWVIKYQKEPKVLTAQ